MPILDKGQPAVIDGHEQRVLNVYSGAGFLAVI
jgi:hypothetical protein